MSFISVLKGIGHGVEVVGGAVGPTLNEINRVAPNPYTGLAAAILAGIMHETAAIELAAPNGPGAKKIAALEAQIEPNLLPIINAVLAADGQKLELTAEMLPKFVGLANKVVAVSNELASLVYFVEQNTVPAKPTV